MRFIDLPFKRYQYAVVLISHEFTGAEQIISWCLNYSWPERIKDPYVTHEASIFLMPETILFLREKISLIFNGTKMLESESGNIF